VDIGEEGQGARARLILDPIVPSLPARGAGGLDADLHQDIFCCSPLPAVIGGDRQLVLVLLPIV